MDFSYKHLMMFTLSCVTGWTTSLALSPGERFHLLLVDNISHYTTVGEVNNYDNRLRLQNISLSPADLNGGENVFKFYRTASDGTIHKFAELCLTASGTTLPMTVTPSIRYYDEDDNVTENGGNAALNYASRTYTTNDTIDLYGIMDYVNDVFSVSVADNMHPDSYTYYATFNEAGDEPQPVYQTGDVLGSLDINNLASGNNTLNAPWGGTISKTTTGPGSPYAIINRNNSITFTLPEGIDNEAVTVAITTPNSNQGAGTFIINGNSYTATKNKTNYFVVNNVSSGGVITISGNNANSPRIVSTSTIYIYYGNYSGN